MSLDKFVNDCTRTARTIGNRADLKHVGVNWCVELTDGTATSVYLEYTPPADSKDAEIARLRAELEDEKKKTSAWTWSMGHTFLLPTK